jgi:hypothetical protein
LRVESASGGLGCDYSTQFEVGVSTLCGTTVASQLH